MPDYRTMFDSDFIRAWDLGGRSRVLTIEKVERGTLKNPRGKKEEHKPVIWFKGAKRAFAANKTNAKTIATLYGNDTTQWIGKSVELYPTRTQFGSEEVDCIRIRPSIPRAKAEAMPEQAPPQEQEPPEPGSEG